VGQLPVVALTISLFAGFFLWMWFQGLSPFARLRSAARKRHWSFDEDADGLRYGLKGSRAAMNWLAEWNGRSLRPYVELSVPDSHWVDGWWFITPRERDLSEPPRFLAGAFTGKAQPEWFAEWMHAQVIATGRPELDQEFVVAVSSPMARELVPIGIMEQLRGLPVTFSRKVFLIRGKGKLVLHVEQIGKAEALPVIERLAVLAERIVGVVGER
jgi:hypothetical protein